jgi:MoxR-like ATPase
MYGMSETNVIMKRIVDNIGQVLVGKESASRLMVIALASSGHVLIEDVPGIGKTTMAFAMAKSVNLSPSTASSSRRTSFRRTSRVFPSSIRKQESSSFARATS